MAVPPRELRILYQKSGNRCAFQGCRKLLTAIESSSARAVVLGHVAHMVADSPNGPRGDVALSVENRNKHENLVVRWIPSFGQDRG